MTFGIPRLTEKVFTTKNVVDGVEVHHAHLHMMSPAVRTIVFSMAGRVALTFPTGMSRNSLEVLAFMMK